MTESMLPLNRIIHSDCVEAMRGFPEDSVDCIVTDPPYGLHFMNKDFDKSLPPKAAFVEMCRVLKPGGLAFVMSSPRQDLMWRMGQLLEESGFELGQSFISHVYASGFPKAFDIEKGIEKKKGLWDNAPIKEIKKDGISPTGLSPKSGWHSHNMKKEYPIKESLSPEAKKWSGWKSVTGLKPALEVIFMVQKPLSERTIVDNVLKWGTGAMNVDACRIPFQSEDDVQGARVGFGKIRENIYELGISGKDIIQPTIEQGRFPANLIVSDDILNDGKVTKSTSGKGAKSGHVGVVTYGEYDRVLGDNAGGLGDMGSFSRYFDLDAWAKHHGILQVPKASTSERERGLDGFEKKTVGVLNGSNSGELNKRTGGKPPAPRTNIHPTVKPVKLMAYLIELGCPPGGVVLDPFLGSGTTCVAAKMLSRRYIGIEIEEASHRIAEARVSAVATPLDWFQTN